MSARDDAIDEAVKQLDTDLAEVESITDNSRRGQARAEAEDRYLNKVRGDRA
jgi:hypothetical protein